MTPGDCLFCKIAQRKIPAEIVYESDDVLGFKDLHPQAPVHVLFIPKKHLNDVQELSAADPCLPNSLILAANGVARQTGIAAGGCRLVINSKKDGGQTVDHLHLHLLGGRKMTWPPG